MADSKPNMFLDKPEKMDGGGMSKLDCLNCGQSVEVERYCNYPARFAITCVYCGLRGPYGESVDVAVAKYQGLADLRALARKLAEALKAINMCGMCAVESANSSICGGCEEKVNRDDALADAKAAGVIG